MLPPAQGALLINRLIWLGIGRRRPMPRGRSLPLRGKRQAGPEAARPRPLPKPRRTPPHPCRPPASRLPRPVSPHRAQLQLANGVRSEAVLKSPAFPS